MNGIINLRLLQPGTIIGLSDGSTAEVVSNPLDGVWVFARYLSAPNDASMVGREETACNRLGRNCGKPSRLVFNRSMRGIVFMRVFMRFWNPEAIENGKT